MATVTFNNSGSVQPAGAVETAVASIAGGPFSSVDAYVSGGTPGVQLEFRLYATVGALRSLVATAPYAGPGTVGNTVLEWTVIEQPEASYPAVAGASTYDLVVIATSPIGVVGAPILATLAGANSNDAPVLASAPAGAITNVGCAELADVGANLSGATSVAFDLFVSCGAGSVEGLIKSVTVSGSDGLTAVMREVKLPIGTQYRVNTRGGSVSNMSLATYNASVGGGGGGGIVLLSPEVSGPSNANVVTGPFSQASLKWKNTVLGASLGTNVATATMALLFGAAATAVTFDPVNGDSFTDNGGIVRAKLSLTHGIWQAGGGGTDCAAWMGPLVSAEASDAAVWMLPNATAPTGSNYSLASDGTNLFVSAQSGFISLLVGGSTPLVKFTSAIATFSTAQAIDATAVPATPTLAVNVYVDSADNSLKAMGQSGDITILAVP